MRAQVELEAPERRVILRNTWGSVEDAGDDMVDDAPPPPPRAPAQPLKINTDLRLVRAHAAAKVS